MLAFSLNAPILSFVGYPIASQFYLAGYRFGSYEGFLDPFPPRRPLANLKYNYLHIGIPVLNGIKTVLN